MKINDQKKIDYVSDKRQQYRQAQSVTSILVDENMMKDDIYCMKLQQHITVINEKLIWDDVKNHKIFSCRQESTKHKI